MPPSAELAFSKGEGNCDTSTISKDRTLAVSHGPGLKRLNRIFRKGVRIPSDLSAQTVNALGVDAVKSDINGIAISGTEEGAGGIGMWGTGVDIGVYGTRTCPTGSVL
jgi:hypothetical protein